MIPFSLLSLPSRLALIGGGLLALLVGPAAAQTPAATIEDDNGNVVLRSNTDGGLAAPAQNAATGNIPATAPDTLMMWYPGKAAFRAGEARGTEWDDANIGDHSIALGRDTRAESFGSVALGDQSVATGSGALAAGFGAQASNSAAVAMGNQTSASGATSFAVGSSTTASGLNAVAMGTGTTADSDYSFAAGRAASANGRTGAFVWGDGTSNSVNADNNDQVVFQAGGGMKVYTRSDLATGVVAAAGSGTWSSLSSEEAKTSVESVRPTEVLKKVKELEVSTWRYEGQDAGIRHMGPMAEEFYEAFELGHFEKRIATVDADGVSLAAIQGLAKKVQGQKKRLRKQQQKIGELRERVKQLETLQNRVSRLERQEQNGLLAGLSGNRLLIGLLLGGGLAIGLLWPRRT